MIVKSIRLLAASCTLTLGLPLTHAAIITQNFSFPGISGSVPDGIGTGLVNVKSISSSVLNITDLTVSVHISGGPSASYNGINGDLYAYVQHSSGFSILINRPGMDGANPFGYFDPGGINAMFNDGASGGDFHSYQVGGVPADGSPVTGVFEPDGRMIDSLFNTPTDVAAEPRTATLSSFNGLDANGSWTLYVEDYFGDGSNFVLESWALSITGDDSMAAVPEPGTMLPLAILLAIGLLRKRR